MNHSHSKVAINMFSNVTISSIIAYSLSALQLPNIISNEHSHQHAKAEIEVSGILTDLFGWDQEKSMGVFTFGGTGCNLYATKIGIEKCLPSCKIEGIQEKVYILSSDKGHYSKYTIADWLGVGTKCMISVETDKKSSEMNLEDLKIKLEELFERGKKVACIIATIGTTDSLGMDDLEGIYKIREELIHKYRLDYKPHIHADAVFGWAFSVFRDYDLSKNYLNLPKKVLETISIIQIKINGLQFADTVGIDFHKSGFSPYVSSMIMVKEKSNLEKLSRNKEDMPYLFNDSCYNPGLFTLETSRNGGAALAALASLNCLGREGYQRAIAQTLITNQYFKEMLGKEKSIVAINEDCLGAVTLFRVYPPGLDSETIYKMEIENPKYGKLLIKINEYNRRIMKLMNNKLLEERGTFAVSYTEKGATTNYNGSVVALKTFVTSAFSREMDICQLLKDLKDCQKKVQCNDLTIKKIIDEVEMPNIEEENYEEISTASIVRNKESPFKSSAKSSGKGSKKNLLTEKSRFSKLARISMFNGEKKKMSIIKEINDKFIEVDLDEVKKNDDFLEASIFHNMFQVPSIFS